MYLLLTWNVDPGPTSPHIIDAELRGHLQTMQWLEIVRDHTVIMESTGGDPEYDALLSELRAMHRRYKGQLVFALVKSKERYFKGEGFDKATADQIID
jgi:hypothetical protein